MEHPAATISSTFDAPLLGVVLTGGTVGSDLTDVANEDVVQLRQAQSHDVPELLLIRSAMSDSNKFKIAVRRPLTILSEDIAPNDWLRMADAVESLVADGAAGILLLHGTDTMSYTAAALSFLLNNVPVPIVITGSNWPPNQLNSDAFKNTHDALIAVRSLSAGTYIAFAGAPQLPGWVHLGTCVRKVRASGQAFVSVNRPPVGKVVDDTFQPINPWTPRTLSDASGSQVNYKVLDDRVMLVRLYPGIDFAIIETTARSSGARGVVIELYPSGTGPTTPGRFSVIRFVRECTSNGIVVVATVSAAPEEGRSHLYESSVGLRDNGAVVMQDTLPETALVKLMWALGQTNDPSRVAAVMRMPIAGEICDDV